MLSWRGKSLSAPSGPQSTSLRSLLDELLRRPVSLVALLVLLIGYSLALIGLTLASQTVVASGDAGAACLVSRNDVTVDDLSSRQLDPSTPLAGVETGNADVEARENGKWFVGHFLAASTMRRARELELKWARNRAGTANGEVAVNTKGFSMGVLLYGAQAYEFGNHIGDKRSTKVTLAKQGDFVVWGPNMPHTWTTLKDSLVLTVRWPSIPGDQKALNTSASRR
ncbi:hypothetical protein FVE85_6954 [Porphyridium purpureum]|uniref:Uncharacterized protein n=1 Tax=Porphyridium purpureum TaxID=35688 RepID=A0A5J4Z5N7_PORPP|nr:hypothetical protein FVE85_6954 [Porphyridium purpureum]|eukprot:POR3036..scf295_1